MTVKAGIWIDHTRAIIVLVTDAGQQIKKITAGIKPSPPPQDSGSKSKFTPNDFVAEDKLQRKAAAEHKLFYDDVIASLGDAKSVLVVGPSEAKNEFNKQIAGKKLRGVTVAVEPAEKMTDRQLAAKITEYFAHPSAGDARKPKPAPRKKVTMAKVVKSPKKTKK